jgi:hypothetical protein
MNKMTNLRRQLFGKQEQTPYSQTLACILNRQNNMKTTGLIIIVLATLAFSCQPSKTQETPEQATRTFDKFEVTFERVNKEPKLKQLLGVTWLPNDSIEFRLLTEDGNCDSNYSGKAKNKNPGKEPESDRDEFGNKYYSLEYEIIEEEVYSLKIRIAVDTTRARIFFDDKSGKEIDCIPAPGLVLINKDAR